MIGTSTLCRVDLSLTQLLWPVAPCTCFLTTVCLYKGHFRSFNMFEHRTLVLKKSLSMLVSTDSEQKSLITLPGESQNAWDQCTYPIYCKLKIQAMCGICKRTQYKQRFQTSKPIKLTYRQVPTRRSIQGTCTPSYVLAGNSVRNFRWSDKS